MMNATGSAGLGGATPPDPPGKNLTGELGGAPPIAPSVNGRAAASTTASPRGSAVRRLLAGVVVPAATVAVVVMGLRARAPGGIGAPLAVAYVLVCVGAVSGAILARASQRVALWQVRCGALAASVALSAARFGDAAGGGRQQVARAVATVAVAAVLAISVHMLLAVPDGRLAGHGRRAGAALAYTAAAAGGLGLAGAGGPVPAADGALVVAVLHVLVGWPAQVAAVAAGGTVFLALGMMAGELRGLGPYGGRALGQGLSVGGFSTVVAAICLVIVLGIGTRPTDTADREILGLSMLAAAVAALGY